MDSQESYIHVDEICAIDTNLRNKKIGELQGRFLNPLTGPTFESENGMYAILSKTTLIRVSEDYRGNGIAYALRCAFEEFSKYLALDIPGDNFAFEASIFLLEAGKKHLNRNGYSAKYRSGKEGPIELGDEYRNPIDYVFKTINLSSWRSEHRK